MSLVRLFALPLFGLALWFAIAFAVLSTFARPSVASPREEEPEVVLVAPTVTVVGSCDRS